MLSRTRPSSQSYQVAAVCGPPPGRRLAMTAGFGSRRKRSTSGGTGTGGMWRSRLAVGTPPGCPTAGLNRPPSQADATAVNRAPGLLRLVALCAVIVAIAQSVVAPSVIDATGALSVLIAGIGLVWIAGLWESRPRPPGPGRPGDCFARDARVRAAGAHRRPRLGAGRGSAHLADAARGRGRAGGARGGARDGAAGAIGDGGGGRSPRRAGRAGRPGGRPPRGSGTPACAGCCGRACRRSAG